ncbi:TolC family outer membrane protein [Undibacterium sp.]|uniref:TolC family outer membrane protein n=1 Tax=Undibacterium sp. TaxID=1914977 RepID=UPI0026012722|nr:TolC family outer membrane protein [Undibacterium sp.]
MQIRLRKKYLALTLAFLPLYACAQVQTLKDATQQAILSNPEVLARWHNFQAAGSEREAAAGGYLPSVNLSAGAGRDQNENRLGKSDFNRNGATLSLNQMLYDGFSTRNEVKRLDHTRLVKLFELRDASESVALEVIRAYSDILRYRKLVGLAEDNYVRHRTVFEQIQRKVSAGAGRRVDLEQISGRLALAEANLLTETSNLHDVSARFHRLVGTQANKNLENPALLSKDMPSDISAALALANKQHPSLLAAIENIRSVQSSQQARRASYQPRVDFRARTEHGNNIDSISGRTNNNTAEVVLSWNLFNGGSDSARVRQSADLINLAQDQRDKACRDVRQNVVIAFNDTRKLTEQLSYLDQHQLSIEKARDAYRQQFDIGQRSLLDLLDTENELFQAKRSFISAEYDLLYAYARTHAGMGSLYSALGITQQDAGRLPNMENNDRDDVSQNCPLEATEIYVVDKVALNARANQQIGQVPAAITKTPLPTTPISVTPNLSASKTAVLNGLQKWREAWMGMNPQAYFEMYSKKYTSRESWKSARKARLLGAQKIALNLSDIKVAIQDEKHMTTSFRQDYQSPGYKDVLEKTLYWEEIGGTWLIVNETVDGPPNAKQW